MMMMKKVMINLTDIISESRRKKIRRPSLIKGLKSGQFSSAYAAMQRNSSIYRGVRGSAEYPFWIIQPAKEYRSSKNTSNFYTGLLDGLPSWKEYPKRSRSIICSNSSANASAFGNVLQVFPKNGSKIGVCPQDDFWVSFRHITEVRLKVYDMAGLNNAFISLFGTIEEAYKLPVHIGMHAAYLMEKTYNSFMDELNRYVTKEMAVKIAEEHKRGDLSDDLKENLRGDWEEYFDEMLNPNTNGFKLFTIENYVSGLPHNNEIWTDGISLMMSINERKSVIDAIEDPIEPNPNDIPGIPKPNLDITI